MPPSQVSTTLPISDEPKGPTTPHTPRKKVSLQSLTSPPPPVGTIASPTRESLSPIALNDGSVPWDVLQRRMTTAGVEDTARLSELLRASRAVPAASGPISAPRPIKISADESRKVTSPPPVGETSAYTLLGKSTSLDHVGTTGKDISASASSDERRSLSIKEPSSRPDEPTPIPTIVEDDSKEIAPNGTTVDSILVAMTDQQLAESVMNKTQNLLSYQLEEKLGDMERAVRIRRMVNEMLIGRTTNLEALGLLDDVPYQHYSYDKVFRQCCENVIGYIPLPLGVAGPLLLNSKLIRIPMATTEGSLVASTSRGCKAITKSGGVSSFVLKDGMARTPIVRFSTVKRACEMSRWIEVPTNARQCKEAFDSTSKFVRLTSVRAFQAGRSVYIRFVAHCGDAMGMNMISKGTHRALNFLEIKFPDMETVSLSGNMCTDKKPSAINWIEGRGKSVIAEATISQTVVSKVLKTTVEHLVDLNIQKNLVGSAMAGSIGGNNAHAANIVAAVYLACGQDPAQVVEGSHCITLMEATDNGDLYMTVTMPAIEVGTVGGGTILPPQAACLDMLGIKGPHPTSPGLHAQKLAQIVCGAVLAGELSLASALAAGHLITAHMKHNRSSGNLTAVESAGRQNLSIAETRSVAMSVMSFASEEAEDQNL